MRTVRERDLFAGHFLPGFMAAARQQHHVLGRRLRDGVGNGLGAVRLDLRVLELGQASMIWLMIALGFSVRGLSLVTTTRSAPFSTTAAIIGRLTGSRSPPHPNRHQSLPPRWSASGRKPSRALSSASGVCA
jgi:hypothetical protein